MEKLTPLLEKLAQQLGTTATHLWAVLIAQAKIAFVGYIIEIILLCILNYLWIILFRKTLKPYIFKIDYNGKEITKTFNTRWNYWWEENEGLSWTYGTIFIALGILFVIWDIVTINSIPLILSSLINPEYWALNKILTLLK
jgi:hypothetical protein